jgi:large subunit ribosomal protein L9
VAQELKDELTRLAAEKITLEATEVKIEKIKAPVGIKGSVGNADISTAIADQLDIEVDKKHINLKKALKSEGVHPVDIKLGHGIHATLKVNVVGV